MDIALRTLLVTKFHLLLYPFIVSSFSFSSSFFRFLLFLTVLHLTQRVVPVDFSLMYLYWFSLLFLFVHICYSAQQYAFAFVFTCFDARCTIFIFAFYIIRRYSSSLFYLLQLHFLYISLNPISTSICRSFSLFAMLIPPSHFLFGLTQFLSLPQTASHSLFQSFKTLLYFFFFYKSGLFQLGHFIVGLHLLSPSVGSTLLVLRFWDVCAHGRFSYEHSSPTLSNQLIINRINVSLMFDFSISVCLNSIVQI